MGLTSQLNKIHNPTLLLIDGQQQIISQLVFEKWRKIVICYELYQSSLHTLAPRTNIIVRDAWITHTIRSEMSFKQETVTFKRTRSLSNAVCFKHDNNVCACAVSAPILLPVVNLSVCHWKWIQWHRFPIWRGNFLPSDATFRLFWQLNFTAHITTSGLEPDVTFEFSVAIFTRTWPRYVRVVAIANPSVVSLSSVCNFRAPYLGGWSFRQNLFAAVYLSHRMTSV